MLVTIIFRFVRQIEILKYSFVNLLTNIATFSVDPEIREEKQDDGDDTTAHSNTINHK